MKRLAVLVPAALLMLPLAPHADDTAASPAADDAVTLKAVAARLHDEATDIRRVAEVEYAKAQKECWRKFLVTRCLDDAGQTFRDEKLKAAGIDSRARTMERELKRREVADRDARRARKEAEQAGKQ